MWVRSNIKIIRVVSLSTDEPKPILAFVIKRNLLVFYELCEFLFLCLFGFLFMSFISKQRYPKSVQKVNKVNV